MVNLSSKQESSHKQVKKSLTDSEKKASVENIINAYLQFKADGNTLQIKLHEAILKRLGVKVPR
jgi:hypothetical protein